MTMPNLKEKSWETFNANKAKTNYPQWPNEALVKLAFGDYLNHKITVKPGMKVLDIGCGFGNNLRPFLAKGCRCFGVEVTALMAQQTQTILAEQGFDTVIKEGNNRNLPFDNDFFDLILSINVLHYEAELANIHLALAEYSRVLAPEGRLLLMTVGPEHAIIKTAKPLGSSRYQIQNYDFRDGTVFYCFDNKESLGRVIAQHFQKTETGRITEDLMKTKLDFLVVTGESKKSRAA